MVTRKPVPNNSTVPASALPQIQIEEPTPTSREPPEPWETFDSDVEEPDQEAHTNKAGQHGSQPLKSPDSADDHVPAALRPGVSPSASYQTLEEENVWVDAGRPLTDITNESHSDSGIARIPTVLRPGSGGLKKDDPNMDQQQGATDQFTAIPPVLRPGGGAAKPETNPFKRKLAANATGSNTGVPSAPQTAPPVPPVPLPSFSQLSLAEQNSNPWQPALDERRENSPAPAVPPMPEQDAGNGIWDSAKPSRQATPGPGSHSPALISLPSEGSAGWESESRKPSLPTPLIPSPDQEVLQDSHAWDDLGNVDKGKSPAGSKPMPFVSGASTGSDDWNMVEVEAPPGPPPPKQSTTATQGEEQRAPGLPPRTNTSDNHTPTSPPPPPQPPRPVDKSETYQIKKITWHDASARTNPRVSPILVQNANGPCPLVALVNALSLTTPADLPHPSALVEALRTRERISLGLLLDAVFDELMSERRTKPDASLPDVAELYEFLKGLHTGMNVNPRFVPTPEAINLLKRTSLSHVHPTDRTNMIPGTFETTKEMSLYATFSIPLIHGWLPPKDSPVYEAFTRQASSYEDAQNLLFREEELEAKLLSNTGSQGGISPDEGQIYQDILTIKSFLSISATQLTNYGLDVIRQSMAPGSVAILFRNDHFSTLYRHPSTLELLTLVTDAGYAGHEEVVWESLVDVNGERAEFFSGDFRLVGGPLSHHGHGDSGTAVDGHDGAGEWTTVQGRRNRGQGDSAAGSSVRHQQQDDPPLSPSTEQEDRDLALALQLQEEEDERHRAEVARRRRESHLSEQFIEQQGHGQPAAAAAATRGNSNSNRGGRGGNSNPIAPARRSSNAVNIPITTTSSNTSVSSRGGGRGGTAASSRGGRGSGATSQQAPQPQQQQSVRPLVPPALPARNGRNRGPDEGLDDAPPSYEQASKQTPYVPPQGHPSHPASAPATATAAASSSTLGSSSTTAAGAAGRGRGAGAGPFPGQSQAQGPLRQGLRPAGAGSAAAAGEGRGRDRDCVVM